MDDPALIGLPIYNCTKGICQFGCTIVNCTIVCNSKIYTTYLPMSLAFLIPTFTHAFTNYKSLTEKNILTSKSKDCTVGNRYQKIELSLAKNGDTSQIDQHV